MTAADRFTDTMPSDESAQDSHFIHQDVAAAGAPRQGSVESKRQRSIGKRLEPPSGFVVWIAPAV